jgi:hypothetical protein
VVGVRVVVVVVGDVDAKKWISPAAAAVSSTADTVHVVRACINWVLAFTRIISLKAKTNAVADVMQTNASQEKRGL